jgi:ketosteroid isomerase-like protein
MAQAVAPSASLPTKSGLSADASIVLGIPAASGYASGLNQGEQIMSEQTNLAVVQAAYEAFGRGDIPKLMSYIATDVEWDYPGPKIIPLAGSFRGHQGVAKFFASLGEMCEIESFKPASFLATGDQVVVLGTERARMRRNGAIFEGHWAHAFTLAGGKVTRFREYGDTAAVVAALSA